MPGSDLSDGCFCKDDIENHLQLEGCFTTVLYGLYTASLYIIFVRVIKKHITNSIHCIQYEKMLKLQIGIKGSNKLYSYFFVRTYIKKHILRSDNINKTFRLTARSRKPTYKVISDYYSYKKNCL